MDGGDPDRWSAVAADWAELWGRVAEPVWRVIVEHSPVGQGSRVLDVGCGSGDLLTYLDGLGASAAGIDPAPAMVELARSRVPGADVRLGRIEHLPWPDGSLDLVVSINALQFADDPLHALTELARVARPGGVVAIANWAEEERNDLGTIEDAVARAAGEVPLPDGELRFACGLERLLVEGGLEVVAAGLVETPWVAADDDELVRGVLLGESPTRIDDAAPTVIAAAVPFRTPAGAYRLDNAFRYALGRASSLTRPAS